MGVKSTEWFELWFESNFDRLFNFVMFKVANVKDAEDICATICEKALRNYSRFDSKKGTISNWIFAIARNCIKNYYREESRNKIRSTPLDFVDESDLIGSSMNPEIHIEEKEQFVRVIEAIKMLSVQEQDIISLRYGANFSYIEIAKQLEISLPLVGVSLYRSHKKLKEIIELEEAKYGKRK